MSIKKIARARNNVVCTFMPSAEIAAVEKLAQHLGASLSFTVRALIRSALLDYRKRGKPKSNLLIAGSLSKLTFPKMR